MRKFLTLSFLAASLAAPAFAAQGLQINGTFIPQARIDSAVKQMTAQGQPDSPQLRQAARDRVVLTELLRQEAMKKGLDKSPDYRNELENLQSALLANLYVRDFMKSHPVSEADVRAEYDRMKVQMARKEYRARHILVPSQEEAAKVLEQLKKGARFEDLARQYSIDTGSKANGGDLGFVDPAQLVPEFSGAMTKLAKGQITQTPVKSQFGWHIIQLTDTKEADFPALDAVRAQLEQQIQGQRFDAYIAKLKAQAKVQ